jgi:hypothetical protein
MADPLDRPERSLVYPQCDIADVVWLAQGMAGHHPAEPGVRLVLRPRILVLAQRGDGDAFALQIGGVWPWRVRRRFANCSDRQQGRGGPQMDFSPAEESERAPIRCLHARKVGRQESSWTRRIVRRWRDGRHGTLSRFLWLLLRGAGGAGARGESCILRGCASVRYVRGMSSGRRWASMVGLAMATNGGSGGRVQVRKWLLRDPVLILQM